MQQDIVSLIFYNQDGKVLLQREKNVWSSFKGIVQPNNTLDQALRKEVQEQLQYPISDPFFLLVHVYKDNHSGDVLGRRFVFAEEYRCEFPIPQEMFTQWHDLDTILKLDLSVWDRYAFEKLKGKQMTLPIVGSKKPRLSSISTMDTTSKGFPSPETETQT